MTQRVTAAQQAAQQLAALTARREALSQNLFRAQAAHEQSKNALEAARKTSIELFGTADVDELRQQYVATNQENQTKLRTFDEALNNVETALRDISARVGGNTESATSTGA